MSSSNDESGAGRGDARMTGIADLLSHALALEEEASERYAELAEVMTTHNNEHAAALFSKMAEIELLHVDEIRQQMARRNLSNLPAAHYGWTGLEGPETTDHADLHYLMTPHQALSLALINEQRARDYYQDIAEHATDPEVTDLARELAEEERDHVAWVKQWMERFPAMEPGWDHDDDPPILQG